MAAFPLRSNSCSSSDMGPPLSFATMVAGPPPRYVSMAKAYASEALPRIGIDAVQLHGAVGYTWEFDAHLYLKRSKWVRPLYGDAGFHYERVASLGGL